MALDEMWEELEPPPTGLQTLRQKIRARQTSRQQRKRLLWCLTSTFLVAAVWLGVLLMRTNPSGKSPSVLRERDFFALGLRQPKDASPRTFSGDEQFIKILENEVVVYYQLVRRRVSSSAELEDPL